MDICGFFIILNFHILSVDEKRNHENEPVLVFKDKYLWIFHNTKFSYIVSRRSQLH